MSSVSFFDFLNGLRTNLAFALVAFINLATIMLNGFTDSANAIATCIGTRSLRPNLAVMLAAFFDFLGVFVMTLINANVAETIFNMVDFGGDSRLALIALLAALFAIVILAFSAWLFGLNTSESHALIAGLSGAAIALQGGLGGINGAAWIKVVYGLIISTVLGFGSGWLVAKVTETLCRSMDRRKANAFFKNAQIASAAGMAFMHGAQDGQKFMGVFMLGMFFSVGQSNVTQFHIPIWMMLLCSILMGLGTSMGGYKIIKTLGMDMVKLEKYQGFSADFAASASLLLTSVLGIPVSTSQMKTMSIIGVGASKRISAINWLQVREVVAAWVLTFPGCGIIGFALAKLFTTIFK